MKLKSIIQENDRNTIPKLGYLLNQINDVYQNFKEESAKTKSPIVMKAMYDLESAFLTMIDSIRKEYPNFKIVGNPNGYNITKK